MNNLSFHITDITANSIRAGATEIALLIFESRDQIEISIKDNGCGMDSETLQQVTNPFYTTRTTRRIGLGLPFLIQNAEQTGGSVSITSEKGGGTTVVARFQSGHIDCPPWGDLPATVAMLIGGNPDVTISFAYRCGEVSFELATSDVKEALDGVSVSHPKVILFIKEMIREGIYGN